MPTIKACYNLYKNTGCAEHDDCLTCPLPECIYVVRPNRTYGKGRLIRGMSKHMSNSDIAQQLNISLRTVQRALKEKVNG